ncbi:Galactose oxidase [Mycena chlorophos]|uniref:Galactose oxidase n=1 Tax=Mycena chlorophos TaxID=658473 RepID=A0A8H6TUF3_MYCCL|nr:Galactose oxidase [Mycena chlorophos]
MGWLRFLDKTNWTITSLTAAVIIFSRSAGVVYFASGALATALSVKYGLKRIIRQPRPDHGRKKTYGMPSTHSASVSFYAVYISLAAIFLPLHPSLPATARWFPVIATPWAVVVIASRIWLGHHTIAQVVAGAGWGSFCALVAMRLWRGWLDEYGRVVETWVNSWL